MTDRNTYPYSENMYKEIEREIDNIKVNGHNYSIDVNLIRIHLNSIEQAFKLYKEQIEIVLQRIETLEKKRRS